MLSPTCSWSVRVSNGTRLTARKDGQFYKGIKMKYLLSIWLFVTASAAYAACTTHTYFMNGRYVTCTTCCDFNGNCTTNCF